MNEPKGPFSVVPYDSSGRSLPAMAIAQAAGGFREAFETARLTVPPKASGFAMYDHAGAFVRVCALPVETLTDDPDVTAMAFDSMGAFIVTGHSDGNLRLWDVETGDPQWTRVPADNPIRGVAFVDQGPWVLAWCDNGPLMVFERESGELISRADDAQSGRFLAAIAPGGTEVALTGGQVNRFSLPGCEARLPLDAERAAVSTRRRNANSDGSDSEPEVDAGVLWVAYLGASKSILGVRAGQPDDEVVFWNADTGARLDAINAREICACDVSADGRLAAIAISAEEVSVLLIDTATRTVLRTVEIEGEGVYDLRFTPDGSSIIVHDAGAGIIRIDAATCQLQPAIPEDDGIDAVVPRSEPVIPEEEESAPLMLTRDRQGLLEITALEDRGVFGPIGRAVSQDGSRFAAVPYATDNNYVTVYDMRHGHAIATLPHQGNVQEIWLSLDGTLIAARAAGHVSVWRVPIVPHVR